MYFYTNFFFFFPLQLGVSISCVLGNCSRAVSWCLFWIYSAGTSFIFFHFWNHNQWKRFLNHIQYINNYCGVSIMVISACTTFENQLVISFKQLVPFSTHVGNNCHVVTTSLKSSMPLLIMYLVSNHWVSCALKFQQIEGVGVQSAEA